MRAILTRPILIACLVLLAVSHSGSAAEAQPSEPPAKENFFKRAGKTMGHDAKAGWAQAKSSYKKAGKDFGQRTASAAKRVGREMKESAKRSGEAFKQEFK